MVPVHVGEIAFVSIQEQFTVFIYFGTAKTHFTKNGTKVQIGDSQTKWVSKRYTIYS